jgi:nitronate monooxygenase
MEMRKPDLCELLGIEFPVIMAPMFLVSNEEMIIQSIRSGITGAIPALNYRSVDELRKGIRRIKASVDGPFGINLIVNKSNFLYKQQLEVCCEEKVSFIITSLGSPEETIRLAHENDLLVFCDAIIAVNAEAGGHAGNVPMHKLLPQLVKACEIPVISAGGVGSGEGIKEALLLGAAGVSMGTVFIATVESPVSEEYKNACVKYSSKDIVKTTKLSGTPCTVINTPYVKSVGTDQNWLERLLNRNKRLKKWVKAFVFIRGMKNLEKAAFSATYKTVWCAGPTIDFVHSIQPVSTIVNRLQKEYKEACGRV